ncbi:hypothetical protein EBZ39_18135 [bacterium]|nr:hypothetical protein [bacterium]
MLCVVRALRVSSFLLGVFAGSLQAATSEPPAPVLCIFNDTGRPLLFSWQEDGYAEKRLVPASVDPISGVSVGYVVTHLLPGRTRFRVRFEDEVGYAWFFDSSNFPREQEAPFYCELRWRDEEGLVLRFSARRIQPPLTAQHASPTGVIGMPIEDLMSEDEMVLEFGL